METGGFANWLCLGIQAAHQHHQWCLHQLTMTQGQGGVWEGTAVPSPPALAEPTSCYLCPGGCDRTVLRVLLDIEGRRGFVFKHLLLTRWIWALANWVAQLTRVGWWGHFLTTVQVLQHSCMLHWRRFCALWGKKDKVKFPILTFPVLEMLCLSYQ